LDLRRTLEEEKRGKRGKKELTILLFGAVLIGFLCAMIEYFSSILVVFGIFIRHPIATSDFGFWAVLDVMPIVSCVIVAFLVARRVQFRGWPRGWADVRLFAAVAAGTGALVTLAAFLLFFPRVSISELGSEASVIRFGGPSMLLLMVILGGLYAGFPAFIAGEFYGHPTSSVCLLLFVVWMIATWIIVVFWPLPFVCSFPCGALANSLTLSPSMLIR
jgi:hypothetical protein